jgi:hypothetical protein
VPAWAKVENITLPKQANRHDDSQINVLTGLSKVSGWAYISHDDFVIVRPVDLIAPSHRGPLTLYRRHGDYYSRAARVSSWLYSKALPVLNYNVHMPFLADAGRYLDIAERVAHLPAGFRQSVYGNVVGLRAPRIFDPKVVPTGARPHPSWPVWATSDRSFSAGFVGREIRRLFPEPGPYER